MADGPGATGLIPVDKDLARNLEVAAAAIKSLFQNQLNSRSEYGH
jgi:hypothetical protein